MQWEIIFTKNVQTRGKGGIMERINHSIGCDVAKCRHNVEGKNCTLSAIHVGKCCDEEHCTCCDSFESR